MGLIILGILLIVVTSVVTLVVRAKTVTSLAPTVTLLVCAALSIFIVWSVWGVAYRHEHWATCMVTDKDRGGDGNSYRIYTSDCDTLANEDSLFRAKWNSSNLWQHIEPGKKHRFLIVGSRVPFFSQFANVLDVQPVPQG